MYYLGLLLLFLVDGTFFLNKPSTPASMIMSQCVVARRQVAA